jgi:ribonuclease P protein component
MVLKRFSFPKCRRLVTGGQFRTVLARRRRFESELFFLYVAANGLGYPRLGVSAGKSFGPAAARNRAKRLVREAFRLCQDEISPGTDYLVVVRPPVKSALEPVDWTLGAVKYAFLSLAEAAGKLANRPRRGDCD